DLNRNQIPYNGTGRLHHQATPFPDPLQPNVTADEYKLINYAYVKSDAALHDPEHYGWRASDTAPAGPYVGGFNAPYTYPDLNTMCLAVLGTDPQGNTVVVQPSFQRNWTGFNGNPATPQFNGFDPNNPNWYRPSNDPQHPEYRTLKYLTLRPRPADMGPGFP